MIMRDGINCCRIPRKDAVGLSTQIMNLLSDSEKRSVIAKNATQTIIDYLSNKKDKPATQDHAD